MKQFDLWKLAKQDWEIETGIPGQNYVFMMNSATYFMDMPHH